MSRYKYSFWFGATFAFLFMMVEVGTGSFGDLWQVGSQLPPAALSLSPPQPPSSPFSDLMAIMRGLCTGVFLYGVFGGGVGWLVDWLRQQDETHT
jgi:hypothetical protein